MSEVAEILKDLETEINEFHDSVAVDSLLERIQSLLTSHAVIDKDMAERFMNYSNSPVIAHAGHRHPRSAKTRSDIIILGDELDRLTTKE